MQKKSWDKALVHQVIPPQIRKGDLRKIEIVEAAVECISTIGVDKMTFEAVGRRSRIGKSHVLYHFPKLEGLVMASVRYVWAVGQGVAADFLSTEKKESQLLKAYIDATFHWLETHPGHISVASLLAYLATRDEVFRKVQTEIALAGTKRVEALIVPLLPAPVQKKRVQVKQIAESIHSLIIGKVLHFYSTNSGVSVKTARAKTLHAAEKLLSSK